MSLRDAAATMTEIEVLRARTARPNVFVKVPATSEGVEAIAVDSEGHKHQRDPHLLP